MSGTGRFLLEIFIVSMQHCATRPGPPPRKSNPLRPEPKPQSSPLEIPGTRVRAHGKSGAPSEGTKHVSYCEREPLGGHSNQDVLRKPSGEFPLLWLHRVRVLTQKHTTELAPKPDFCFNLGVTEIGREPSEGTTLSTNLLPLLVGSSTQKAPHLPSVMGEGP